MLNPGALLYSVPLLHRLVPIAAELRGITIKIKKLLNISMNYSVYTGLLIEKIELIEYFYNLEFWDSRGTWEDRFKII
jgi:hypothetical protein